MATNQPNPAASTNQGTTPTTNQGKPAPIPGFLVGVFTSFVVLTGISLVAVPILTIGAVHSIPAGTETARQQGGSTGTATASAAAPAAPAAAGPAASEVAALRMLNPGDAEQGEEQFAAYCVACHGPDGKGRPNLGKDLVDSKFVAGQSDIQMILFLKKGRDASDPLNTTKVPMPPKGGNPAFTDAQLNDVVAYLRKLQKKS